MKNMEKLVPVAVAGLMLASAGTLDARAEDVNLNTLPQEGNQPSLEQTKASNPLDTTIQETAPTPGTSPTENDDGSTTEKKDVNPGVNEDNEYTNDGTLDVNTKPDPDATKVETIPGDPLPPVTTDNGDGSTTTTTTTPTTDVTTEESQTTITGPVTSEEDNSKPSTEEEEEISHTLSKALESVKNEDGTYNWDSLNKVGDFDATHEAGEDDENGNPTHTITLTQEETSDAPLKPEELGKVLGVELTEHTNEDGSTYYTYTGANGAAGTIRNVVDNSTEKKTTTWVLTLTEQTVEQTGNGEVKGDEIVIPDGQPPMTDLPDQPDGSLSVKDVLDKVDGDKFDNEDATITKDKDGNITQIVSGSTTYEFTYTAGETINIENLSIADIFTLLPDSYTMGKDAENNDVIFDAQGHELTFTEGQKVYTVMNVTMSMVNTQAGTEDHITQDGQEIATPDDAANEANAEKNAAIAAVVKALQADQITGIDENSVKAQLDQDTDGNGIWVVTVTATVDGKQKTFTYTVSSSSSTEEEKWDATKVDEKNIDNLVDGSGSTVTTTGSAYVSGETIVWTESVTGQTVTLKDGKVDITVGAQFDGAMVDSVKQNGDGTTTVVTKTTNGNGETVTKTYTFRYGQELTDADTAALLGAGQTGDFTGVTKITWDVQENIMTPGGDIAVDSDKSHFEVTGDITVVKGEGNTYTVTDGEGATITLTKGTDGKYHNANDETDKAVYEIAEEDVPLSSYLDALKAKYGDTVAIDSTGNITYTDNGQTVTVTYQATKKYTVTKVAEEAPETTSPKTSLDDLIDEIIRVVETADSSKGEVYYINGKALNVTTDASGKKVLQIKLGTGDYTTITTENPGQVIQWIAPNTAVNFDAMSEADLVEYLENAKKNDSVSNRTVGHLELVVNSTLNHENETGITDADKECVVIPGVTVKVAQTAEELVYEGQTVDGKTYGPAKQVHLNDEMGWDTQGDGWCEYNRDGYHQNLGSNSNNGQGTSQNPGFYTYQYYRVTGTVAYGEYTTLQWWEFQNYRGPGTAVKVATGRDRRGYTTYEYRVYTKTASLDTYGYLGEKSNNCDWQNNISEGGEYYGRNNYRGYDLTLGDLTLLKDGRTVTASGQEVTNYTATLTKKTTTTQTSGSSLDVTKLTASEKESGWQDAQGGSALSGTYQITETKTGADLKDQNNQWKYAESGSSSYDVYQTWTQEAGEGQASYNKLIDNLALGYTYTYEVPGEPNIVIDSRSIQSVRNVNVVLDNTTVTTTPGEDIEDVVINRPTTPPPVIEDDDDDDDDDDGPTIVDEDVPLVETPELPDVEIPDEEVPMVETPDVELPDEDVPLAELPDEEVPLAAVPQTNDSFLLEALALVSSGMSALWLGLNKKRK